MAYNTKDTNIDWNVMTCYLSKVREALYSHHRGASVIVGSGLSRHAQHFTDSSKKMPTWQELGQRLQDELPIDPTQCGSSISVLELAQSYETIFGRKALHEFLKKTIRCEEFTPQKMHQRFLKLPWREVFTTNWDTLLERQADQMYERLYELVRQPEDVGQTKTPRIIKLHGSLDGIRSPVVTEKDYDDYEKKSAVFVNTVRQAMIEDTIILIGFSGNDPNFKKWLTWLSENLEKEPPSIYLGGWFSYSSEKINHWKKQNVYCIDLAKYPHKAFQWQDDNKESSLHSSSLEYILEQLEILPSYPVKKWPQDRDSLDVVRRGPEALTPMPKLHDKVLLPKYSSLLLNFASGCINDFDDDFIKDMMKSRKTYSGWIGAPSSVRNSQILSDLVERIVSSRCLKTLGDSRKILLLREVVWLIDLIGRPLTDKDVLGIVREMLQKRPIIQEKEADHNFAQEEITEAWIEVAFSLAKTERLLVREQAYCRIINELKSFETSQNHYFKDRLLYEQCLWDLMRLDYFALNNKVQHWDLDSSDPIWYLRKAFLLFELGDSKEPKKLCAEVARKCRQLARGHKDNIRLCSLEAWALCSLNTNYKIFFGENYDWQCDENYVSNRWGDFTDILCNPDVDIKKYEDEIRQILHVCERPEGTRQVDRPVYPVREEAPYRIIALSEELCVPTIVMGLWCCVYFNSQKLVLATLVLSHCRYSKDLRNIELAIRMYLRQGGFIHDGFLNDQIEQLFFRGPHLPS